MTSEATKMTTRGNMHMDARVIEVNKLTTRGQWPFRPAATRAMKNRHVMLYDLNYLSNPKIQLSDLDLAIDRKCSLN